jgi:hypothetical protein
VAVPKAGVAKKIFNVVRAAIAGEKEQKGNESTKDGMPR